MTAEYLAILSDQPKPKEQQLMSKGHGMFVWYDVMTTDTKPAQSFYHDVIGWNAADSGMPDRSYTIFSMGPTMIGGLMPIPEDTRKAGAGPAWMGYIGVDDVDAYAKRVTAAGGAVHRGPEDIPGIGRFAVAGDPHGAGFIIFKGASDQVPTPPPPNAPGHIGWRELHAGNGEAAFAFYSKLFGWTKGDAVDMGPMGVYQVFTIGGAPSGGMMTKMPDSPAPHWLYYFNVEGVDAAAARVKDAGGRVLMGPHEVPGGHWIVQCFDPQGAMFAMIAPKR
jgi:predicted enzyme related to lactoylglutathione lyase